MKLDKQQEKTLEILGQVKDGDITRKQAVELLIKNGVPKYAAVAMVHHQTGGKGLVES